MCRGAPKRHTEKMLRTGVLRIRQSVNVQLLRCSFKRCSEERYIAAYPIPGYITTGISVSESVRPD